MDELHSLCRTCGSTSNKDLDTKLFDELNYPLVTLIEDITDMWIEYDNTLPEHICSECKTLLDQILRFRASCLSTHKKLMEARKKVVRNQIKDRDISDPATSIVVYEEMEEVDINNSEIDEVCAQTDYDTLNQTIQSPEPQEACIKKKRNNLKRSKKTWICEQCGGEFKCSTYLKLHLLRHTGKKEFECDICKAGYYTQNEMLRHRILHSNARPYACRFCDKTFRGSSSKAVHERSHTNERPFACQFCEKTFTSSSVRKMHERVHANNRNFHCEPCDQWFLRSSHLLLHQRTKLHKSKIK